MDKSAPFPFFIKISQVLIGIVALFFVLFIGQAIILPLIYSLILAILLNPAVNFLVKKKFNRLLAISIIVVLATIAVIAFVYFLSSQMVLFGDALPQLQEKFNTLITEASDFIATTFNTSPNKLNEMIAKGKEELSSNSSMLIGKTLSTATDIIIIITLLPVYIFMFLYYKPLLLEFIERLSPLENQDKVREVLLETKLLIQSYLSGLLLEALIVSSLNSAGLLILGVDYAILIGVIGGLLNIIPYIGGIVATALPMILALATQSPTTALLVLGVYIVVQFIDNNFIMPVIVASRVKINALFSVIVVLIGGALWGVAGMFLAIPLTAIAKVIFDRVKPLQPWGFLLGDTMSTQGSFLRIKRKTKPKAVIK